MIKRSEQLRLLRELVPMTEIIKLTGPIPCCVYDEYLESISSIQEMQMRDAEVLQTRAS